MTDTTVTTDGPDLTTLPAMDVAARAGRLREQLFGPGTCDALLVTNLVNIRWLTGFTGSAGKLLVRGDDLLLVVDGRYGEQAGEQLAAAGVEAEVRVGLTIPGQYEILGTAATSLRLGFEADHVTVAEHDAMRETWFPFVGELVATTGEFADLRLTKDDGEIARIEAAAAIATAALDRLRGRLLDAPTEAEFGLALDTEMRRLGASGPSFETIVASGPNSAKPHHRPSSRRLADGDLVILDFGAKVDGYCSDMTRTFCLGPLSPDQQRLYDVVAAAQAAGVVAVKAGASCRSVDAACRDLIAEAGWRDAFSHGTGHGVGLDIHEDPRVSFAAPEGATLVARSVVTVEPGVYLPGVGGVRIEDSLVVTDDGSRILTHAPKDPDPTWPSRPTT
jgi:Xaa-Pro aminopeptidase